MGTFGNELDRAEVSAYNKLYDHAYYHRVMSSQYNTHHQTALVIHAYEKMLPLDKSRKMEGGYHGQTRTAWFLWRESVKPLDIHRRLSATDGEKELTRSSAFDCAQSFYTGCLVGGNATLLKIGTVKPHGSSKGDGSVI
jgi:hypothetical protein